MVADVSEDTSGRTVFVQGTVVLLCGVNVPEINVNEGGILTATDSRGLSTQTGGNQVTHLIHPPVFSYPVNS